jgi:hypothetical protein
MSGRRVYLDSIAIGSSVHEPSRSSWAEIQKHKRRVVATDFAVQVDDI